MPRQTPVPIRAGLTVSLAVYSEDMAMPEPARSMPDQASRLESELADLDALVHELASAPPEDIARVVAALDARMHDVKGLAADFAHALRLWADPETQARAARFRARVDAGEPIASVPVDEVIDDLRQRRTDLGV